MSKTVIRVAGSLAATILASAPVAPAHAETAGKPAPGGFYIVSVMTQAGQLSLATLGCEPHDGTTHPHPRKACAQLAEAEGDIVAIPPADGLCTMEYAPVLVRAEGVWNGTPKVYEKVFSNRCVANLQTGGHVFNI